VPDEDIILYGQSVGSGPTIDLASRLPNLRAVVLHSPILSGLRVLYPVKKTFWFDIYKVNFTPTFSLRIVVDKWLIYFPLFCRMSTKSA
jgi:alpha-beta hydrolase superfamily lysophospholipase